MVSKKLLFKQLFLGSYRMHFTEKGGVNQAMESGIQESSPGERLGEFLGWCRKTVILAAQQTCRATSPVCKRRTKGLSVRKKMELWFHDGFVFTGKSFIALADVGDELMLGTQNHKGKMRQSLTTGKNIQERKYKYHILCGSVNNIFKDAIR